MASDNYRTQTESDIEKSRLLASALWPVIFVLLLWIIKGYEELSGISLSKYGLAPKSLAGLTGILTYPFLHKDIAHLVSNSAPLLVLGTALFYYYGKTAIAIFWQIFFISGFWLWAIGLYGSVHIGASGLVYGLAAFHLAAGLIKRNTRQMAFSVLVIFLYGSMVWGIFPDFFPNKNISWEGHLMGMIAGLTLAWFYRGSGPRHDVYEWEDETEEDDETEPPSATLNEDEGNENKHVTSYPSPSSQPDTTITL